MEHYFIFYADRAQELEQQINEFMEQQGPGSGWEPSGSMIIVSWGENQATYYQAMWRK